MHALAQEPAQTTTDDVSPKVEQPVTTTTATEEGKEPTDEKDFAAFKAHLDGLFSPLEFPTELAKRVLTHASHPASSYGHNAGFTFMGRRVLESYFLLFLTSSNRLKPTHDLEELTARAINTYTLGKHIGPSWGLGRIVRWVPTLPKPIVDKADMTKSSKPFGAEVLSKRAGLYKVQGDAVAAVLGAIFHQFGGAVAHRVFHTRILPNLVGLGPYEGVDAEFEAYVHKRCAQLGDTQGDLVLPASRAPSSYRSHVVGLGMGAKTDKRKVLVS